MLEIFKDYALTWYRHNNTQWTCCDAFKADFLKFFFSPCYLERFENEIRNRTQGANKTFKDYLRALQHLQDGRKGKSITNFPKCTL